MRPYVSCWKPKVDGWALEIIIIHLKYGAGVVLLGACAALKLDRSPPYTQNFISFKNISVDIDLKYPSAIP